MTNLASFGTFGFVISYRCRQIKSQPCVELHRQFLDIFHFFFLELFICSFSSAANLFLNRNELNYVIIIIHINLFVKVNTELMWNPVNVTIY